MEQVRKPAYETDNCFECEWLMNDNGIMRCVLYDSAIIEDTSNKQCKDSIR